MIKDIKITNYRKHVDTFIKFDERTTVFVGENDTGKSSLLSAIQYIFKTYNVKESDFFDPSRELRVELKLSNELHVATANLIDGNVVTNRATFLDGRYVADLRKKSTELTDEELPEICRRFGIRVAQNSRPATLRENLSALLSDGNRFEKGNFRLDTAVSINTPLHFLSGMDFNSVDKFIHEAFFRSRQKDIWDSPVDSTEDAVSIAEAITNKLLEYKAQAETEIEDSGISGVISNYIRGVTKIELIPVFDRKEISVSLNVNLRDEMGRTYNTSSLGDGSKRRLTVALLQHKASFSEEKAIYLFDEPDTHLHVKAQNDLLNALDSIAEKGNQVIITTHSPFIMNAVKLGQVRVFGQSGSATSIRGNIRLEEDRTRELAALGIENLHLFFTRKFLILEGESEESFFPIAYEKITGHPPGRDFIKTITAKGIDNIPRFAEIFKQFAALDDIFVLSDNDAFPRTKLLVEQLDLKNVFRVGKKEFEDAFHPEIVYLAWREYVERRGSQLGPNWTSDNLSALYFDPQKVQDGLSKHLPHLNTGSSTKLTKVALGTALAEYCSIHQMPDEIQYIIQTFRAIARDFDEPMHEAPV